MSFEQLMNSIQTAQRDAGERAVIAHLEAQGLAEKQPLNSPEEDLLGAARMMLGVLKNGESTFDAHKALAAAVSYYD